MSIDWNASHYKKGAFIQHTVAMPYLDAFTPKPDASILDIGCGDGAFTLKLLQKIPNGELTAIDSSEEMLRACQQTCRGYSNITLQQLAVEDMAFDNTFDAICSFWCLQWTKNVLRVFTRIHQALKPGGRLLVVIPSGDDALITSVKALQQGGDHPELTNFKSPLSYDLFQSLEQTLAPVGFSELSIKQPKSSIQLPSLDTAKQFFEGVDYFFKGQVADDAIPGIIQAQTAYYDEYCKTQHNGEYLFEFTPIVISAVK